jgi:cytochrome c556
MSVTLTIDEALLREAEQATNIHDWPTLVMKGLQSLCRPDSTSIKKSPKPFDFDAALASAAALPDLTDEEFTQFQKEMNRPLPPSWSV